jgi:deoxyadenosine/deoxycytidine kinase
MIVSILGLIGTGKSTLVNKLASNNSYTVFEEPVDSNPFLSDYYKDPNRWSFTLQVYYLWERYKQVQEAFMKSMKGEIVILDSSIYSDFAFAMLQHSSGYFTDDEYNTYTNMHRIITAQTAYPDVTIWLQLSEEQTLERIKERSRDCESEIQLKYLKSLNKAYQTVLEKLSKHTNIITIDATPNANIVYENVNQAINNYSASIKNDEMNYV